MSPNPSGRLRRSEASAYLFEKYGIERKATTLAKIACLGGGPKFEHAGRFPLYPIEELDAWAASIMGPLKASTSDKGTPKKSRPAENEQGATA